MATHPKSDPQPAYANAHRSVTQRADARRNAERVLRAAHDVFAEHGLTASYHVIAQRAGVGVGTVYRHYPERVELLRAVLLDTLAAMQACAEDATIDPDGRAGFNRFFLALVTRMRSHAGLSESLDAHGGPEVADARRRLLSSVATLCETARRSGLRADVDWRDVLFLAQAAGGATLCALGTTITDDQARRCAGVIVDGMFLVAAPEMK